MKKAVLYIRVSTDEQADKGYSLQHQEERLQKYCTVRNIEIIHTYKEDFSAKTFDRPVFKKLLEYCKKNRGSVDYMLFIKWDRFSRNTRDSYHMINELDKLNVEAQAIEQPLDLGVPENKLMLAFYLAAPEVENDRRALNVCSGMRRAKKEGRWVAWAPKGYKNTRNEQNRPVIEQDKNAVFVKEAFEQMSKGIYTQEEIREKLNKRGFVCSKNNFNILLKNRMYTGKIFIPAYKDEEETYVEGIHKPIISEDLYNDVQDIINGKRTKPPKHSKKEELPLRGFLECARCGAKLTGSASRGKMGTRYFYYHCKSGCPERFKADQANQDFEMLLKNIALGSNVLELYTVVLKDELKALSKDKTTGIVKINEDIARNQERINQAQQLMLDKEIDLQDYKGIKTRYENIIINLSKEKANLEMADDNYLKYLDYSIELIKNLDQLYDAASLEVKQKLVSSIYPEKLIYEKNKYRTPKANAVIELITMKNRELPKEKKGLKSKISFQSLEVNL